MYSQNDILKIKELIYFHLQTEIELILFGSYAKGTSNNSSDIDLAVLTDKQFDRQEKIKLLSTIRWQAAKMGYSIDIILKNRSEFYNEIHLPTLSMIINSEGIRI